MANPASWKTGWTLIMLFEVYFNVTSMKGKVNMRKLATIREITDIQPIEGKDRIVLATVDGWHVIVQKNDFNVGSKAVYMEIDSVLPEKPEFEFLRPKKFLIKTMKMAGVISQGICFPLSILPPKKDGGEYEIGEDVTDIIGVKQYEGIMDTGDKELPQRKKKKYPAFLMRFAWFRKLVLPKPRKGGFPSFISKTDEERIQNMPWILKDKKEWVATEKIDGQSGTFALVRHKGLFRNKFEYIVCSRNLRLTHPDGSSYWQVSERYHIENALKNMIGNREWVAIQGECVGPKIQQNKYRKTECDLYVFNLLYPTGRVDSIRAKSICENHGFNFVPIVEEHVILPDTVDEVLAYADGESRIYDTLREGIVFRSFDGKQSFKAVSNKFLLKWSE